MPNAQPPARPDTGKPRDPFGEILPISGPLGLADLVLDLPPGEAESVEADVWSHEQSDWMTLPLRPRPHPEADPRDATAPVRWGARVRLGPAPAGVPEVRARLRITPARPDARPTVVDLEGPAGPPDHLATPDWAKGAVWYQIFPERFRNGNPANDPKEPGVYRMPWGADWDSVSDAELEFNKAAAVAGNYRLDFDPERGLLYNVVWHRRFGGDLQGVVEKLDYLADLGVTAIYLTPVFSAASMHKYDAADFRHVDPTLGDPGYVGPGAHAHEPGDPFDPDAWPWTDADRYFVDVFLPEAKARGFRVILDGVWNHTGREFWAFQHLLEHGAESPYAEWYHGVRFDDAGNLVGWTAWDRPNGYLPKFRQTPTGDLVEPVKRHIFAVTQRWMDPNGDGDPSDGIDGWRLDVAAEIGIPFWRDWRAHVRSINPDAILIAEIWYDAGPSYFNGVAFDAQMNYPFAYPVTSWLGSAPEVTSATLARALHRVFHHAPQHGLVQMNLVDSHDVERIASMMHNPGRTYEQGAAMHDNPDPNYDPTKPSPEAYDKAVLATAIMATYLGSPMIYAGNELGMYGADDPDNRKPLPWPDLGTPERGEDAADLSILARYRAWLRLRQDPDAGPVLRYGDVRHLESADPAVFAFERTLNTDCVRVVVNASDEPFDPTHLLQEAGVDAPGMIPPRTARAWWSRAGERSRTLE